MSFNNTLKKLTPDATLNQIMSADQKAGELLASIGVELSKHKEQTLRSVCQQRQWSETEVLKWIKTHSPSTNKNFEADKEQQVPDFGTNVLKWVNYIEEKLLAYNIQLLHEISDDFPRVQQIHGNQYPWLKDMQWNFEVFDEALRLYFTFEKKKFFYLTKKLHSQRDTILDGTLQKLERCLCIIEEDQDRLQRYMKTIQEKGKGFENPDGACTTLRILNQNFKMLYSSLYKQFKMEKEILLPLVQKKLDAK